MLIGLWLSTPRVHDRVAVVSVISSTITTPGGPGGPGGRNRRHGLNMFESLKEKCFLKWPRKKGKNETIINLCCCLNQFLSWPIVMFSLWAVTIRYTNGCNCGSIRREMQLCASGDKTSSLL